MKKQFYRIVFYFILTFYCESIYSQSVANYTFTPTTGTFSYLSTYTQPSLSAGDWDDGYTNSLPIGFTFNYGGTNYTTVSVSTNGWMVLGSTISGSANGNALNGGGTRPLVAPLWDDISGSCCGWFRYATSGSSPNRIFTMEWYAFQWNYNATSSVISFQTKLYETTNVIDFIYKQEGTAVNTGSASIGIAGSSGTDFWSLNGTGASPTANYSSETTTLSTKPATNQIYRWSPCSTPTTQASTLTFSGVGCAGMTANWTNGNGAKRIVKCNTSNSFTAPVDGTDPAANAVFGGSEQVVYNGTGTSVAVTGLTAGATYWFRVYEANCSGTGIKFNPNTSTDNPLSQAANPPTPATPGAITGTITQCQNATGQTYSISSVSNATTYTWTLPAGAWAITGGSGTTSITVTAGNAGQNGNITVTAGNSCGTSAAATLAVTVAAASTPIAGPDQYICSTTTSATMAASGTGTWTQITGPAATITTPTSASTTITGLASGTYVFRWTAGCGGVYDDVIIIRQ